MSYEYLEEFIEIRDILFDKVKELVEVYMCDIWDPLMKYTINRDMMKIIKTDIANEYPDFPIQYLPKIRLEEESDEQINVIIQEHMNPFDLLNYLGTVEYDGGVYDLYCRDSWTPDCSHVFYAIYGNDKDMVIKGASTARDEFFTGVYSPLSIAYQLAVDQGYIKLNNY